eukprot:1154631-Pelagomonas_calceolata.AAC.1
MELHLCNTSTLASLGRKCSNSDSAVISRDNSNTLLLFISELMDLLLADGDQSQADYLGCLPNLRAIRLAHKLHAHSIHHAHTNLLPLEAQFKSNCISNSHNAASNDAG